MDPVRPDIRPHTPVLRAWLDGWRRVLTAPALIAGLVLARAWTVEWQWAVRGMQGWVPGALFGAHFEWIVWQQPFAFGGLGALLGSAAATRTAAMLVDWFRFRLFDAAPLVLWLLVTAGALDRLARARRIGFFGVCVATGVLLGRLVRLAVVLGGAIWVLAWVVSGFGISSPPMGLALTTSWAADSAAQVTIGLVLIAAISLAGDLAAVRIAVEDRRSVLGALGASLRFVRRRPIRMVALYLLNLVPAFLLFWLLVATGPTLARNAPAAFGVWQWAAIVAEVVTRLGAMAATIAFFQAELAHAGYTARPVPTWPDSPAIEAITRLETQSREAGRGPALPL